MYNSSSLPNRSSDSFAIYETDMVWMHIAQNVLYKYITPVLCVIGFLGNSVNLLVLTRGKFRKSDSGKESRARVGLVMLSISDMLFCIALFPRAFVPSSHIVFSERGFALYYQAYGAVVVTTFILTSTWIIVVLAVSRYIAICHPFFALKVEGPIFTVLMYGGVVVLIGIPVNLPSLAQTEISPMTIDKELKYMVDYGYMDITKMPGLAYQWVRNVLCLFIPAGLLIFCNVSLTLALRQSYRMRRQCYVKQHNSASQTTNRITLLLIVIALAFIILVFPSEIMDFCGSFITANTTRTEIFIFLRSVANVLQVLNFSCNFILYCALNVHYRSALHELITCEKPESDNGSSLTKIHQRSAPSPMMSRGTKTSVTYC